MGGRGYNPLAGGLFSSFNSGGRFFTLPAAVAAAPRPAVFKSSVSVLAPTLVTHTVWRQPNGARLDKAAKAQLSTNYGGGGGAAALPASCAAFFPRLSGCLSPEVCFLVWYSAGCACATLARRGLFFPGLRWPHPLSQSWVRVR
jgi:hypothetical protein